MNLQQHLYIRQQGGELGEGKAFQVASYRCIENCTKNGMRIFQKNRPYSEKLHRGEKLP